MTGQSGVSLSAEIIAREQPLVVEESIRFHSRYHGEFNGNLSSPSSGSDYGVSSDDKRQRLLELVGLITE